MNFDNIVSSGSCTVDFKFQKTGYKFLQAGLQQCHFKISKRYSYCNNLAVKLYSNKIITAKSEASR